LSADFPRDNLAATGLDESSKFQTPNPKEAPQRPKSVAAKEEAKRVCHCGRGAYLSRLMPKAIARSKTKKAVRKRFKITGRGKVLRAQSSRRHLLSSKNAKRRRHLGKMALVHETDIARVKANLPFG
jgi:large subunit ribosomal protein L35